MYFKHFAMLEERLKVVLLCKIEPPKKKDRFTMLNYKKYIKHFQKEELVYCGKFIL